VIDLGQAFLLARTVGAFSIGVFAAVLVGGELQVLAVGRPHLVAFITVVERQTGGHVAIEVVDPDVPVAVAENRQ